MRLSPSLLLLLSVKAMKVCLDGTMIVKLFLDMYSSICSFIFLLCCNMLVIVKSLFSPYLKIVLLSFLGSMVLLDIGFWLVNLSVMFLVEGWVHGYVSKIHFFSVSNHEVGRIKLH